MSAKTKEIEEQLAQLKKVENKVCESITNAKSVVDSKKIQLWDTITPHIINLVQKKLNDGTFEKEEVKNIVFDKVLKCVFGDDILDNLGKI